MELIDEAPEMEPLPSQRGGSVEDREDGGVWYYNYSLETEVPGDDHPHPPTIMQYRRDNPKVSINVGGHRHEILWKTLERKPLTRLGQLARAKTHKRLLALSDGYSLTNNEVYFDRDPAGFNGILNFYR